MLIEVWQAVSIFLLSSMICSTKTRIMNRKLILSRKFFQLLASPQAYLKLDVAQEITPGFFVKEVTMFLGWTFRKK